VAALNHPHITDSVNQRKSFTNISSLPA
jgi:hypothetical protein